MNLKGRSKKIQDLLNYHNKSENHHVRYVIVSAMLNYGTMELVNVS